MRELIGIGHKLEIDGVWDVGVPMIRGACEEDEAEEDVGQDSTHGQRAE